MEERVGEELARREDEILHRRVVHAEGDRHGPQPLAGLRGRRRPAGQLSLGQSHHPPEPLLTAVTWLLSVFPAARSHPPEPLANLIREPGNIFGEIVVASPPSAVPRSEGGKNRRPHLQSALVRAPDALLPPAPTLRAPFVPARPRVVATRMTALVKDRTRWASILDRHPPPVAAPAQVLRDLAASGAFDPEVLPLPGRGRTMERFRLLSEVAEHDVALARLVEGHADALAVLAEAEPPGAASRFAHRPARPPGELPLRTPLLGVWAAGPAAQVRAKQSPLGGAVLDGSRRWCSGAGSLTHALVTAAFGDEDAASLFLVDLTRPGVLVDRRSWPAVGMAATDTFDVAFEGVACEASALVGAPGWYLDRPGFWHGAAGVAACWWGGARGVARVLTARLCAAPRADPIVSAAHGEVAARLWSMECALDAAATAIDAHPADAPGAARVAQLTRLVVERAVIEVVRLVGDATGAEPLAHDAAHARRVADLSVYVRQHHGARDAAVLSALLLAPGGSS